MSLAFLCSSTETEPHSLMDGLDPGLGVKVGWSGFLLAMSLLETSQKEKSYQTHRSVSF